MHAPAAATVRVMIDAATYTAVTGDTAPDNFVALEARVVRQIESACRPVVLRTRTETLTAYGDRALYPSAGPIVSADGYAHDTVSITADVVGPSTVTYTAGYTPETAPTDLQDAIAWGIHTLLHPAEDQTPAGVTSLQIAGEYQVAYEAGVRFGADGVEMPATWSLRPLAPLGGRCASLLVPYRRL